MKSPKNTTLYSRLALITSVTLVVGYFVVYALYENLTTEEVAPGATVSSTLMTKIKNNFEDLSGKMLNFGFSNGNVGIGTAGPASKLHIIHSSNATEDQSTALTDVGIGVRLQNVTAGQVGIGTKNSVGSPYEGDFIVYNQWFNGAQYVWKERMRVRSDGNVGIGTTTPTVKLEVNGKFTAQDTIQFPGGAKIRQMVVKRGTLPNANGGPYFGFGPSFPKAVLDSSKCIGFATPVGALVGTSVLVTWAGMADSVNSYFSCSNCTASTQFSFMVIEYE